MLVDDIPILELYYIRGGDVSDMLDMLNWTLTAIEREIDFINKLGGVYLEKWIVANYFPDGIAVRRDEEATTAGPVAPTAAPAGRPAWLQELLAQLMALIN